VIELRDVTAGGLRGARFALAPGEACRLLLDSEADLTLLLRLLVGTAHPIEGTVTLFGRDLDGLPEDEALALFARVGLVWPGGGFVSNLKVWENLLLPLWYHGDADAARREPEVLGLLERLGMEPDRVPVFLGALPGSLPARERRVLGVVRAMLQDAEVMVYAGLFEGLDGRARERLLAETVRHHAGRPGRASLYVAAGAQGLPEPFAGRSLRQDADGGIVPWP
jgi:phospholipid/cholesterol/gamma-HCH transport system ATP-binding protein